MNEPKMTYDDLNSVVTNILNTAEKQMADAIEKYNKCNQDNDEVDTVDLDGKFDPLHDYVGDYLNA